MLWLFITNRITAFEEKCIFHEREGASVTIIVLVSLACKLVNLPESHKNESYSKYFKNNFFVCYIQQLPVPVPNCSQFVNFLDNTSCR
jgi:hypothetical protein